MNYVENNSDYSCPKYCGVSHKHIEVEDGFYYRLLGTTDSVRVTCYDIDKDACGHRCVEGQGQDVVFTLQ
jgi:hypothetical protein